MKKIKILLAVIAVVSMLTTVAFAGDSGLAFSGSTIAYTDGSDLVISVTNTTACEYWAAQYIVIEYDGSVWEYVDTTFAVTTEDFAVAKYNDTSANASLEITIDDSNDLNFSDNQKLFDLKFSKRDGKNAVGTVFTFADDDEYANPYSGSIEVVAGATSIASTNYTDKDGKVWSNVPNATCTLTGVTGTKIAGTIDINYTEGGTAKKATGVAATALEGLNLSNANVTFTVAIVGVPDTITVNSFVPNLTVQ